jgi:ABC-2 type transport system ATP-binding protein
MRMVAEVGGLLELKGLTRRYGPVTALDGLTFSVRAGQVVGFLGPNGAGKTTTMRAVFGLTDLAAVLMGMTRRVLVF